MQKHSKKGKKLSHKDRCAMDVICAEQSIKITEYTNFKDKICYESEKCDRVAKAAQFSSSFVKAQVFIGQTTLVNTINDRLVVSFYVRSKLMRRRPQIIALGNQINTDKDSKWTLKSLAVVTEYITFSILVVKFVTVIVCLWS